MPSSGNASGHRKVRCPKCTALLTEPQTQIYECPICSTLLLAKANLGSRSSETRAHKGRRDARDIQQIVEGGSKLEKARLIDEFNSEQVQQGMDNVEGIASVGFEGRSRPFKPDLSYDENAEAVSNIRPEGHLPLDLDDQPLSGTKHTTETGNVSVPKIANLSSESYPVTADHRKSRHLGDMSLEGESEHQFSELDSASRTESEADLDSPTWSSDNANIKELPEVPSMVSSYEALRPSDRSREHLSTTVSNPSSGAGGNDGGHRLQDESEPEMRQQSNARFGDRGAEEEIKQEERHQSLPPYEVADKDVLQVEKKLDLDSRTKSTEVLVVISSAKSVLDEVCTPTDQISQEMSYDKEIDSSHNSSSDCISNGLAGSTGIKISEINLLDSKLKDTGTDGAKVPRNDGDRKEVSNIGKFRLFDLSVFGIYNEETYSELRRGKAAHYSKLSESDSDCNGLQSTPDGEKRPHSSEVVESSSSQELDCAGGNTDESVAEVQKSSSVSELPVVESVNSHVETGSYRAMNSESPQQDSDVRSSVSVGREVDDGGITDVEDAGLLPITFMDTDAIANARYGDILAVKDLGVEVVSSIDISFGDWRLQQVVKPPLKALEQNHADAESVHEKRMLSMVTGEGTDSSWDDDDELIFSNTSKEDPKFAEGTAVMEKEAQTSTGTRRSSGRSQAKSLPEKPAFPLRTTAMQKFLKREDQEGIAETQSPQSSELYEAPYVEHYTPPPEKNGQEAYNQTVAFMSEPNVYVVPDVKEDKPSMIAITNASEDTEKKLVESLNEDPLDAHFSLPLNINNGGGVSLNPLSRNEDDVQTVLTENVHSRKESDSARSPQRAVTVDEMDQRDLRMAALDSQKVDYWLTNKVGSSPGKPTSLRWKGKGGSSTQSLSSTEDEEAYGADFEAGRGPDRGSTKKQGIGSTEGRSFPDNKEVKLGLGNQPRGHNQPNARGSQRSWLGNIDVDRQKHGSGELVGSRRTARSRPSLSNQGSFAQADRLHMEGRISSLDTSGLSVLDRQEQVPAFQGQSLNLNRSMLDQGSNYTYNGTADYNSDHSSRSLEVPPHPQHNERYMSSLYGMPSATSARGYPLQAPHGSVLPAPPLQEQGLTHPAHHCASPSCSLCIQQQYYMQQPQMLQTVMLHPCAACASQSSAAAYQPMHHEMHAHHMHALTYSNPSLRQHDSGVLPAQSRGQNRSNIHQSRPVPTARRLKLHPPLPGKGAPSYVLCRACNQLLQVPGYLPPLSGPIQKLHCGACGKTSKFSIPILAASPSANMSFWPTTSGLAMNASDMHNFSARDNRRMDTGSIHSSEQVISSVGPSTSGQNWYGMARHTSGQGFQHEWVENRSFLQPNASGIPSSQTESVRPPHLPRPMAGSVPRQAQYRSQGGQGEGEHHHTNPGIYNEDYASSSPSSASSSSPGRHSQMGRQIQQVEPHRKGRPGFGERNLSADLPALSTMHEQGRSPFEAPSFSDGFSQKGANEGRSRFSSTSLQGSLHDSFIDSPHNEHMERLQVTSKAGSWHNQPADAEYSDKSSSRGRTGQMPAAPGSPLIEHSTQDAQDVGPTTQHRHMLRNSGNGSRSAPWSPASGSPLFDPHTQDASADFYERFRDRERPPLPGQDASKGPKSFAGLLKRSIKDLGKGGQGGSNRRKVVVNGHLIPEAAVRKAEEQAGTIHSGTYWYDYQAGFWGVMGGPCLGILMPFIEEFHFPLARDCAGGTTGILVNGRELHEKDLEVLAKRGLPRNPGKAYILDISGALFDDVSGQPLRGLGKLAPSIEKKGRGFGMTQFTAQP